MSKFFNIFLILGLCACSLMGTNQIGDIPDKARIQAIKADKHSKEDVIRLLGSPSSITLFEKESWLYIDSKEKNRVFLGPKEIERNVVKITFKNDGLVEKVTQLSLEDGQKIEPDKTVTPVSGKDLSVIDELIGNFGRFPANRKNER